MKIFLLFVCHALCIFSMAAFGDPLLEDEPSSTRPTQNGLTDLTSKVFGLRTWSQDTWKNATPLAKKCLVGIGGIVCTTAIMTTIIVSKHHAFHHLTPQESLTALQSLREVDDTTSSPTTPFDASQLTFYDEICTEEGISHIPENLLDTLNSIVHKMSTQHLPHKAFFDCLRRCVQTFCRQHLGTTLESFKPFAIATLNKCFSQ